MKNKIIFSRVINKPLPNRSVKYYNTKQWRNLRNRYINEHPFCEICAKRGRAVGAEHVHHKSFILNGKNDDEIYALLTNEDNIMSVCRECHQKLHAYAKMKGVTYADDYPEDFKDISKYLVTK